MSSGSEAECPLCMNKLDPDDVSFFPCSCRYQICQFCWHRIRTDENGLCPACRRPYSEDPVVFEPLQEMDLKKLLKEKKQKESKKKRKAVENRTTLENIRVVQKNLVFVVGLSSRLADAEVLKKPEYFGKFGKILKIVINLNSTYAGGQGPSPSAYVTYYRSEDAMRAIQAVNNQVVDGRAIKASLGTTKYCTFFLHGAACTKSDCMYLHELGDKEASFTKEQMQQQKHLEYEQSLYDAFNQNSSSIPMSSDVPSPPIGHSAGDQSLRPPAKSGQKKSGQKNTNQVATHQCNAPSRERRHSGDSTIPVAVNNRKNLMSKTESPELQEKSSEIGNIFCSNKQTKSSPSNSVSGEKDFDTSPPAKQRPGLAMSCDSEVTVHHSLSLASASNPRELISPSIVSGAPTCDTEIAESRLIDEDTSVKCLDMRSVPEVSNQLSSGAPVVTDSDVIGCRMRNSVGSHSDKSDLRDDDLGFDPWNESTKGLADMMEKENNYSDPHFTECHFLNYMRNHPKVFHLPPGVVSEQLAMPGPNRSSLGLRQMPNSNLNCRPMLLNVNSMPSGSFSPVVPEYHEWQTDPRHVLPATNGGHHIPIPPAGIHLIPSNRLMHHLSGQNCNRGPPDSNWSSLVFHAPFGINGYHHGLSQRQPQTDFFSSNMLQVSPPTTSAFGPLQAYNIESPNPADLGERRIFDEGV